MPYTQIVSGSLIFGQHGWEFASPDLRSRKAFGSDRHGKIVAKDITLDPLPQSDMAVFLGTEACFGIFGAETLLVTRAGRCFTARALVESSEIGEFWFENVTAFPFSPAEADRSQLLAALSRVAPLGTEARLARRCARNDTVVAERLRSFSKLYRVGNDQFLVLDRVGLQAVKIENWKMVFELARILCTEMDDDGVTFEVDDAALAAWYYSALASSREYYMISFDSLQHSLFAKVQLTDERPSPFKNGRCGYLERKPYENVRILWDDPSWSPIINGFLVRGV